MHCDVASQRIVLQCSIIRLDPFDIDVNNAVLQALTLGCAAGDEGVLMPVELVWVLPVGPGWIVSATMLTEPLPYHHQADAVTRARDLASTTALAGSTSWLIVKDAGGAVVERRVYRIDDPATGDAVP